jgi:hypothetical protein
LRSHRKKAVREIERSSWGVRDDAKMERSTAGVTGTRLLPSVCGWSLKLGWTGLAVEDDDTDGANDMVV